MALTAPGPPAKRPFAAVGPFRSWEKGDILPIDVPIWSARTKWGNVAILLACTVATAAMQGYDTTMMGGMNILPQYTEYFHLTQALRSFNVASNYTGGCIACLCWGWITDVYGRRVGLFWSSALTIVAAALQGASQNIGMFVLARVLIGFSTTASVISGSAYLAETLPWEKRAWGLALFNDLYYVGAITGASVTYGSFKLNSTWSWRLPSLLQIVWGVASIALLPWMPESPRWLVDQGRGREALEVLANVNADGDTRDDLVRLQYRQICDTIRYERAPMTYREMIRHRGAFRRLVITASCALFSMLTGNIIFTYSIGSMLLHAGISSGQTQLMLVGVPCPYVLRRLLTAQNVGLAASSLVFSLFGSFYTDRYGVKSAALISTGGTSVSLFLIGALTKAYGDSNSLAGIWSTVGCIFLFSVSYAFGWVPILFLLPAEVLFFRIRVTGMSLFSLVVCVTGAWASFVFPVALDALAWRLSIINGAWNILFMLFIWWYWIEIKGRTLEEIDALFDGRKHSDTPDVEAVLNGTAEEGWREKLAAWVGWKFGRGEDMSTTNSSQPDGTALPNFHRGSPASEVIDR